MIVIHEWLALDALHIFILLWGKTPLISSLETFCRFLFYRFIT